MEADVNTISVLSQETIDKIAAGEVVERPSSIVKELAENAIDAGANAVTVEIRDGGTSLIRITDNGSGMAPEDIPVAFLRHATSKIRVMEDLQTAGTLGFRGEALSSIAAIAQVELITKTVNSLTGIRYLIDGGVEKGLEEIGAPSGTTFLVRNMFYNTPVRKKFLKSNAAEAGYISDLMERLALSHPEISFKFMNQGQTKMHTSGNGRLKDVVYGIYGRDISSNLLPVEADCGFFKVTGFIGKPLVSRGNRNYENYFVNGRYVRSNVITKAIEEAYRPYMMSHRYPFTVLAIAMDGKYLDINVHPTKMEVRFSDQIGVYEQMIRVIRDILEGRELIPEVLPGQALDGKFSSSRRKPKEGQETKADDGLDRKGQDVPAETREKSEAGQKEISDNAPEPEMQGQKTEERSACVSDAQTQAGKPAADAAPGPCGGQEGKPSPARLPEQNGREADSWNGKMPEPETEIPGSESDGGDALLAAAVEKKLGKPLRKKTSYPEPFEEVRRSMIAESSGGFRGTAGREKQPDHAGSRAGAGNAEKEAGDRGRRPDDQKPVQMDLFDDRLLSRENVKEHRLIGQVFDTYWLVEFREKLYIIDQHAAHEKVLYERFMKQLAEKQQTSQMVSPPLILSLSMQEEQLLEKYMDNFTAVGFEIEPFGGREYSIRAVPGNLYDLADRDLFLEMLDSLGDISERAAAQIVNDKIALMSCKAAVKGNNRLSAQEADELIGELLNLENPYNCPHGRPTIISMSKYELGRKFKRTL